MPALVRALGAALAACVFTLVAPAPSRAQGAAPAPARPAVGTVEGELKVGDSAVPLKYVYVTEIDDVEGKRLSGPQKSLLIQLTDTELAPNAVASWARSAAMAREGKLRSVEIQLDPVKKAMFGGTVYHASSADEPASVNISVSGTSETYLLENLKIDRDNVSGTVRMPAAEKWPRFNEDAPERTFQYRATFSAPIRRQPPVTATLTGKAAQTSPQAQGMLKFEAACRKGDFAAARKLATPDVSADWDTHIQRLGEKEFLKLVQGSLPDTATRTRQIVKVVVRGDRATVIVKEEGATGYQPMVKRGTAWVADAP